MFCRFCVFITSPRRAGCHQGEKGEEGGGSAECKESLPPMNWIVQRCSLEAGQRPCEKARLAARWDVLALLSARFACSERKEGGQNWIPATSYPRRPQWNGCCRCFRPGNHSTSDLRYCAWINTDRRFFWSSCRIHVEGTLKSTR